MKLRVTLALILVSSTSTLLVPQRVQAEESSDGQTGEAGALNWPWAKLVPPTVPEMENAQWVENPIDAFVLAKLQKHGLAPAPPALPRAVLRRLYFGLVGLPPSPEEMEAFLKDRSRAAYAEQVEKLLRDDAYGERWSRHWLDLVRYADTQGGALDYPRPHMWRYRDYVVRAFNQDRPYDRFIREQLAGDSFRQYGDEGQLGLAFLHQWVPVERTIPQLKRRDYLNDVVGVTGSVFLGLTLTCARCHDHKYDPLPARDYYRIEAFFTPLEVSVASLPFSQYEMPGLDADKWKVKEQQWKKLLEQRKKLQDDQLAGWNDRLRKRRIIASSADIKDLVVDISDAELRTAMEESSFFSRSERDMFALIRRQTARFANPNVADYYAPKAYAAVDSQLQYSVATFVLSGGNFKLKEEEVDPGYLTAATDDAAPVDLAGVSGSRRKLLADWIANPENPLTARVMVNRIWQHHFGKALVETASDFGENGSGTIHQELLDWLAVQFIESGWSIKHIQRLIVTSNVYQQAMTHPQAVEFEKIDPTNQYLWVRDAIRLEAEVIRDNVLATSGQLNRQMGGPPFFPEVDDELMQRAPTWWEPSELTERNRRTIYMLQIRSLQMPFIKVFDGPNVDESCSVREVTTVTPQVFALFNSKFVQEKSLAMAERIEREVGTSVAAQVERAFKLAFQRSPSASQREESTRFLSRQENDDPNEPRGSLADLCLVLLNSNEFVFLE
jgi:hypothetical protein